LDIGYVLFGDDYKRGELLVNLSREHKKANNDCGNELADYLPNLLRLIPKIEDEEFRNELVAIIILPALAKITKEFDSQNIEMKNNVYKRKYKTLIEQSETYGRIFLKPLLVIMQVLEEDFDSSVTFEEPISAGFTESITTEIKID
jgi:nitrate reductase assembly molybdenum cofactor insertion protein NarJ